MNSSSMRRPGQLLTEKNIHRRQRPAEKVADR